MARKKQGRNAAPESDRHSQDGESDQNHGYAVGYRRPPKHTRFKPGQSGNPLSRHYDDLVETWGTFRWLTLDGKAGGDRLELVPR